MTRPQSGGEGTSLRTGVSRPTWCLVHGFFRTAGASLGVFALLNALGDLFVDNFGADFLWIRFPGALRLAQDAGTELVEGAGALATPSRLVLVFASAALVYSAFAPLRSRRVMLAAQVALALVALAALWNALGFWWLLILGQIRSWFPIPSSLAILAVIAANAWRIRREHRLGRRIDSGDSGMRLAAVHGVSFVAVALLGPLVLFFAYGATDYSPMAGSRAPPVDCIVVYGAKVYADGTPSLSLFDRVQEGVGLWHDGRGRHLVLSGGVGESGVSEPRAMKRLAMEAGVDEGAIVLDETGANTYLSAAGTARLMRERGWRSSISVSHYYHLLRIQMAARRVNLRTLTVPARMTRRLLREPYFVLRECAAFYGYYFFRWGTSTR